MLEVLNKLYFFRWTLGSPKELDSDERHGRFVELQNTLHLKLSSTR